jgi:hypothetical protein
MFTAKKKDDLKQHEKAILIEWLYKKEQESGNMPTGMSMDGKLLFSRTTWGHLCPFGDIR